MIKYYIKYIMRLPSLILLPLTSRSEFLSRFNYLLLSTSFGFEQRFLSISKQAYIRNVTQGVKTNGKFRRDLHRIEKGLSLKPMKNPFAAGYILSLCQMLRSIIHNKALSGQELEWAVTVLNEYFQKVDHVGEIKTAFDIFEKLSLDEFVGKSLDFHSPAHSTAANLKWLDQLMATRRSVRAFTTTSIAADTIEECIKSASNAPTACNRQPYRFLYTNDPQKAKKIAACAGGTGGWVHNINNLIVVCGDQSNYISERDRHLIYIDSSLAGMQLVLQLEARGLASCIINWPDQRKAEKKIRKHISIAAYERPIFLIAFGKACKESVTPNSLKKEVLGYEI